MDSWPRSKHDIRSIINIQVNTSEVSSDIIQEIVDDMDNNSLDNPSDELDKGPNPRLIDVSVDAEMQRLSNNGYRVLRKNKKTWDELSIDNQK